MGGSSMNSSIAIVGLACRLPSAADPGAFWQLLQDGTCAISGAPADRLLHDQRLHDALGQEVDPGSRWGGFLDDIALFDADFFGISPNEAAVMDPQQRLMLELCWEALEDAAIAPNSLADSQTGVFVGAISSDYADLVNSHAGRALSRHVLTGTHRGLIANRVSYAFGLRGPSLTVDTGQSSSLVAVHLASESVRRGESRVALVGGVHLNISPNSTLMHSAFGGLSPDGRCYTFDARANGYVRGEGGGVVVLKSLATALADGDPIYAVISATAVNNDGGGEHLVAPNPQAQEEVLRQAYRKATIKRGDVQYIELHGTGTKLGDRVEAQALGKVIGARRPPGWPLQVGSAKTNIGHLEAAGGIVGLIKVALSLEHGCIPPSINFESPNPELSLDAMGIRVAHRVTPWPSETPQRVAGVSSFAAWAALTVMSCSWSTRAHLRGTRRSRSNQSSIRPLNPLRVSPRLRRRARGGTDVRSAKRTTRRSAARWSHGH